MPIYWNADITYNYQSPLQIAQSSHIVWFTVTACSTLKFKTMHYVNVTDISCTKFLKWSVIIGKGFSNPTVTKFSRKLTWNKIMEVWKTIFPSKWAIFRFHVNFQACTVVFMFVPSLLAIFLKDLFAFRLIFYNVPFHTLTSTTSGKHS